MPSKRSTSSTSTRVAAIRRLAELTFDHHEAHPDFIRLVASRTSTAPSTSPARRVASINSRAVDVIGRILSAARRTAGSRRDVDAVDVHMMISSFCVFRVANRHTFGAIFDRDLVDPGRREHYRHDAGRHGRRVPAADQIAAYAAPPPDITY